MLNAGAQFQYSDRLIENSNPQKITFSEVLRGALHVLSWQPISLFISEHVSSYSAYIFINNCSFIWYRSYFREMNIFYDIGTVSKLSGQPSYILSMIMCIQNLVLIGLFILKILSKNYILTSIKGRNSVANLPKYELIQAFMHVLFTCKNEEDRIKTEGARVFTRFLPL